MMSSPLSSRHSFWLAGFSSDFRIDDTNLHIRIEQLRTRMSMYPTLIWSQFGLQPLFVWLYWAHAPHYWLLSWLVTFYAFHVVELIKWRRDKDKLNTLHECEDWHVHFTVFALGTGLLWAVAAIVFFPMGGAEQNILSCVMLGLVAGAVTMAAAHPPSLYAFVFGLMTPLIVQILFMNDINHGFLALLLFLFTAIFLRASQGLNRTFVLFLQQRFENADLLQKLQAANALLKERVDMETQLNQEKEQLMIQQSRSAAMGEMINNIAHQWRQPLNTLGLVVQNISLDYQDDGLTREELDKYVETARQCVTNMSETIDDFRNFFRPDKRRQMFNLHQVVNDSLRLLAASFKNNSIEVTTSKDQNLQAYGNINEFSQVILNVLANAKDALVAHNKSPRKIEIEIGSSADTRTIVIRDNAGGIPEDALEKIFDPYFTTKASGSGIGLYMSKTIIEKHMGGSIASRNTAEGAEFTISIPLKTGGDTKASAA